MNLQLTVAEAHQETELFASSASIGSSTTTLAAVAIIVVALGAIAYKTISGTGNALSTLLIAGVVVLTIIGLNFLPVYIARVVGLEGEETSTVPAPVEQVNETPAEPMNWTPWIAAATAALVIASLCYIATRTRHQILDRKALTRTRTKDWQSATAHFNHARDGFADYLADPYAIFERPLLDDKNVATTAAFIDALAAAEALHSDEIPQAQSRIDAFRSAAQVAAAAWDTANAHAINVGMGRLTAKDKKAISKIQALLAVALDESATPDERDLALSTVHRLAEGLLVIPDRIAAKVILSLGSAKRKALTV